MKKFISILCILILFIGCSKKGILYDFPKLVSQDSIYENVVYVDADGYEMKNDFYKAGDSISMLSSGLSELALNTVMSRIREAYSLFKVTITRDEKVYLKADPRKRMRVVLTESSGWYNSPSYGKIMRNSRVVDLQEDIFGTAAGGVSFVGSFVWGDDTPCFVFTDILLHNIHNIAEAAAHEIGHTLGLYHQSVYDSKCMKTYEYREGYIMGSSYKVEKGIWGIGQSAKGCTVIQDDIKQISLIIPLK